MSITNTVDPYAEFASPASELLFGNVDPKLLRIPVYYICDCDYRAPNYKYICPFCKQQKWYNPKARNEHAIRCIKNSNAINNKKPEFDFRGEPDPNNPGCYIMTHEKYSEMHRRQRLNLDVNSEGELRDEILKPEYLKQQRNKVNIPTVAWIKEPVVVITKESALVDQRVFPEAEDYQKNASGSSSDDRSSGPGSPDSDMSDLSSSSQSNMGTELLDGSPDVFDRPHENQHNDLNDTTNENETQPLVADNNHEIEKPGTIPPLQQSDFFEKRDGLVVHAESGTEVQVSLSSNEGVDTEKEFHTNNRKKVGEMSDSGNRDLFPSTGNSKDASTVENEIEVNEDDQSTGLVDELNDAGTGSVSSSQDEIPLVLNTDTQNIAIPEPDTTISVSSKDIQNPEFEDIQRRDEACPSSSAGHGGGLNAAHRRCNSTADVDEHQHDINTPVVPSSSGVENEDENEKFFDSMEGSDMDFIVDSDYGEDRFVALTVRHTSPVKSTLVDEDAPAQVDTNYKGPVEAEDNEGKTSTTKIVAESRRKQTDDPEDNKCDSGEEEVFHSFSDSDSELESEVDVGNEDEVAQSPPPKENLDTVKIPHASSNTEPDSENEGPINVDQMDVESEVVIESSIEDDTAESLAQSRRDDWEEENMEFDAGIEIEVTSPLKADNPNSSGVTLENRELNTSSSSSSSSSGSTSVPSGSTTSSPETSLPESSAVLGTVSTTPSKSNISIDEQCQGSIQLEKEDSEEDDEVTFLKVMTGNRKRVVALPQSRGIKVEPSSDSDTDSDTELPESRASLTPTVTVAEEDGRRTRNQRNSLNNRRKFKRERDTNGLEVPAIPLDQNLESVTKIREMNTGPSNSKSASAVTITTRYDVDGKKELQIILERVNIPARAPVVTPVNLRTCSSSTAQKLAAGIKRAYSLRSSEPPKIDVSENLRQRKKRRTERERSPAKLSPNDESNKSQIENKNKKNNSIEVDHPKPKRDTPTEKTQSSRKDPTMKLKGKGDSSSRFAQDIPPEIQHPSSGTRNRHVIDIALLLRRPSADASPSPSSSDGTDSEAEIMSRPCTKQKQSPQKSPTLKTSRSKVSAGQTAAKKKTIIGMKRTSRTETPEVDVLELRRRTKKRKTGRGHSPSSKSSYETEIRISDSSSENVFEEEPKRSTRAKQKLSPSKQPNTKAARTTKGRTGRNASQKTPGIKEASFRDRVSRKDYIAQLKKKDRDVSPSADEITESSDGTRSESSVDSSEYDSEEITKPNTRGKQKSFEQNSSMKMTRSKGSPSMTQNHLPAGRQRASRSRSSAAGTPKLDIDAPKAPRTPKKVRSERMPSPAPSTSEKSKDSRNKDESKYSGSSSETESEEYKPKKKPSTKPKQSAQQQAKKKPEPKSGSSCVTVKRKRGCILPTISKQCSFCKEKADAATAGEIKPNRFVPSCCASCQPKFGHLHVNIQSIFKQKKKRLRCGECSLDINGECSLDTKSLQKALSHLKKHEKGKPYHLEASDDYSVVGAPAQSAVQAEAVPGKRGTLFSCKLCHKKFGTMEDLKTHFESHSLDKGDEEEAENDETEESQGSDGDNEKEDGQARLSCRVKGCGKKYPNRKKLTAHMDAHALKNMFRKSR